MQRFKSIKKRLAERMSRLGTETAFEVLKMAQELERKKCVKVIHLQIGQPDFPTPDEIIEAATISLNAKETGYSPSPGIPQLREVIAKSVSASREIKVKPENVVVTAGGKFVIPSAVNALVNKGEEVIYPNPGYPIYESWSDFMHCKLVPIQLREENDFRLDVKELRKLVTRKTKLIIINSPQNPTGSVLTIDDLEAIAEIAKKRDLIVLSDECYGRIIYDQKFSSIASLPGMQKRTIILDAFSKTYAMTGWRVGYGIMHKDLAPYFARLVTNNYSCLPIFTQKGAIAALEDKTGNIERQVAAMVAEFKRRRDYLVSEINKIPRLSCKLPGGAFYLLVNIKKTGLESDEFFDRLLYEAFVAGLSGTAFGKFGEGYIRLSYANSMENIKVAIERIRDFVRKL